MFALFFTNISSTLFGQEIMGLSGGEILHP